MSPAKLFFCLAVSAVSACAITTATDPAYFTRADWADFGATVREYSNPERLALYMLALSDHEANPSAESAIRLAILLICLDGSDRDYQSALSLLDFAEAQSAGDTNGNVDFVRFLRPLVQQLENQRTAINAEREATQLLRRQLEALRELEEQLNAEDEPL